ncbi:NRAMP family divalent metal transporter [Pseudoalteromonas sp. MTN2-4]|uniref:NRAMP family divalent metal transporter n=1 Tax=Pseudoalteromonas sp. MTN2-4 TaxID=3056555 RepID=UPI0036F2AD81
MKFDIKNTIQNLGPGILMSTAAVGGSHLVASTQAGALFGWQLFAFIIIVNILKYPFFKFAVAYTAKTNKSLVEGYKEHNTTLFYLFTLLNIISAVVNTAGVLLLTALLLQYVIPFQVSLTTLSIGILFSCLLLLLFGHYKALDKASKVIMGFLTLSTFVAFIVALSNGQVHPEPATQISPFSMAMLGFMVALMGWMPAPIEISAINSLWIKAKNRHKHIDFKQTLFDFKLGYGLTLLLALLFFSLGVLLQYGQDKPIELAGVAFSKQLIDMYALTIGEWSRWLIATVAFLCMFGTTITVLDGYSRTLNESYTLVTKSPKNLMWMILIAQAVLGLIVILFFKANIKDMLMLAMTLSFLTTPFFAWLNYQLVKGEVFQSESTFIKILTGSGFMFLVGISVLFVFWKVF